MTPDGAASWKEVECRYPFVLLDARTPRPQKGRKKKKRVLLQHNCKPPGEPYKLAKVEGRVYAWVRRSSILFSKRLLSTDLVSSCRLQRAHGRLRTASCRSS